MSSKKRVTWLNYPHLVTANPTGGLSLFSDSEDYDFYTQSIKQITKDRLIKCYAFCLTKNEIRLVFQPNRLLISKIIQKLHGKYSKYINKKYQRLGPVFRSRFSSLIFNFRDIAKVVRAVHLFPVRKGLVNRPEHYPYSSHREFIYGENPNFDFLSPREILALFPGEFEAQKRAFSSFVESAALEADGFGLPELYPGIGGSEQSIREILAKAKIKSKKIKKSTVENIAQKIGFLLGIEKNLIQTPSRRQDFVMARRLLATACVLESGRSIAEVAKFLGRDKSQISRLVSQGLDLLNSDEAFAQMLASLKIRGNSQLSRLT